MWPKYDNFCFLNLAILRSDQDIRQKYALSVKNKFQSLKELEEVEHQWENFKQAINEAAVEVIPPLKRRAKQKWMTENILKLMDKRRQAKCNNEKQFIKKSEINAMKLKKTGSKKNAKK